MVQMYKGSPESIGLRGQRPWALRHVLPPRKNGGKCKTSENWLEPEELT